MLRRSIDKNSLPAVSSPSPRTNESAAYPHGISHRASFLLRKSASTDNTETQLTQPGEGKGVTLSCPSACEVIALKKAEYTHAKMLVEYVQFYCEVTQGSLSMSAVEALCKAPIVVQETPPQTARLMDHFERLVRKAGFADPVKWFDSLVSRESHALRALVPYNLFSAEMLLLAISCGGSLLDEADVKALFLHLSHAPQSLIPGGSQTQTNGNANTATSTASSAFYTVEEVDSPPSPTTTAPLLSSEDAHPLTVEELSPTHTHTHTHGEIQEEEQKQQLPQETKQQQQQQQQQQTAAPNEQEHSAAAALATFERHLSRHTLSLAYRLRRLTARQLRRLNSIARSLKNMHFVLVNTHTSLRDFRSRRVRGEALRNIGIVELEKVLCAVLAQYSAVLMTNESGNNNENNEAGVEKDSLAAVDNTSSTAQEGKRVKETLAQSRAPFSSRVADGEDTGAEEDSQDQQNEMINEDFAQFFDPEERRLLHNLVRFMHQGEDTDAANADGDKGMPRKNSTLGALPSLPPSRPLSSPHGTTGRKTIQYERRNSILRKTLIQNHLKSFSAYVEAQGGDTAPNNTSTNGIESGANKTAAERESGKYERFSLIAERNTVEQRQAVQRQRRGGLSVEEIVAKNLQNLTGRARTPTSAQRERRPHTSSGALGGNFTLLNTPMTTTIHTQGFSLPSHEKVLQSFDNRLEFVRTSMSRYR